MAFRDRNQGFGFVYVDIKKLLEQTDEISQNPESHPQEDTAFSIHLPKKPTPVPNPAPAPVADMKNAEVQAAAARPVEDRIKQIKENLDRLQTLHHKLHAVLEELSSVSRNNKKKTEDR